MDWRGYLFADPSGGVAIKGLSEQELRTVMYLVGFPNLLVSLHPARKKLWKGPISIRPTRWTSGI